MIYNNLPGFNTESKLCINSVTELDINESNSFNFFANSYSSQVKQYEYAFSLTESKCFLSNSVTELMPCFGSVLKVYTILRATKCIYYSGHSHLDFLDLAKGLSSINIHSNINFHSFSFIYRIALIIAPVLKG